MDFITYTALALTAFIVAILSSIAQGGGNYIITPLLLSLGIPPTVANGTIIISGLAFLSGSLAGFKDVKIADKSVIIVFTTMSIISGLYTPFLLARLNAEWYSLGIGIMLLALAPVVYFKPFGVAEKQVTKRHKYKGYFWLFWAELIAGFTLGLGFIFSYILCHFCGLNALQANMARKYAGFFSSITTAFVVTFAGFVNWHVALSLAVGSGAGSYIGTRYSVKKGNLWAAKILVVSMVFSGAVLIMANI